jgi:hypothetical protein
MTKPLTVERIIAGYKASGLIPQRCAFTAVDSEGNKCGCAMTALIVGEGHATFEELRDLCEHGGAGDLDALITKATGLEIDASWEIIFGFDGGAPYDGKSEYHGYGVEVHQKIFIERVLDNVEN